MDTYTLPPVPPDAVTPPPTPSQPNPWRKRAAWALLVIVIIAIGVLVYERFSGTLHPSVSYGVENLGTPGTTRLIETKYPVDDPVIAKYVVTEAPYNADATGATDDTKAFQQALNDAFANGGGTVFVPLGTYRFDGSITIPEGVILEGEWKAPTASDKSVGGSVLAIYTNKGDAKAKPFLGLTGGAGVSNLNFWYPDQSVTNHVSYPATVGVAGKDDPAVHLNNRFAMAVRNVTFVNSDTAINWAFADGNSIQNPNVENVYGTPLTLGTYLINVSSAPRLSGVSFSPDYWSGSGLSGAPSASAARAYTEANSTGLEFDGSGGSGFNERVTIDGYKSGIYYNDVDSGSDGTDPMFYGVTMTDMNHGIDVGAQGGNLYITGGSISADQGQSPSAVYIRSSTKSTDSVYLDDLTLSSTGNAIDGQSTSMGVNAVGVTFAHWKGYAASMSGGIVVIEGSTFGESADTPVHLDAGVTSAYLMANSGGSAYDGSIAKSAVWSSTSAFSFPSVGVSSFPKIPFSSDDFFSKMTPAMASYVPAKTDPGSLFVVTDYGAKSDGTTDNTAAVQKALDAAKAHGGGTVYFPGSNAAPGSRTGYLVLGNLSVPAGVELRGAADDTIQYVRDTSSILIFKPDANSKTPVITLGAGAGMRGLYLWQENLDPYTRTPFPYLVQSQGKHTYSINIIVGSAYNAFDFGSYDSTDHYVKDLRGLALNSMIYVSKSTSGYINGLSFDPNMWTDAAPGGGSGTINVFPLSSANPPQDTAGCANGTGHCSFDSAEDGPADIYNAGSAITLGSAKNEVMLSVFTHAPGTGITTTDDNGGPSFSLVNFGAEINTELNAQALDAAGATLVNGEWHTNYKRGVGPIKNQWGGPDPKGQYGYPKCKGSRTSDKDPDQCLNLGSNASYIVVGSGVSPSTKIQLFTVGNAGETATAPGVDLAGGTLTATQYHTGNTDAHPDLAGNNRLLPEYAKLTGGANYLVADGLFQNIITNFFSMDASSHGVIAGSSFYAVPATISGSVDTSLQPPGAYGSNSNRGGTRRK